MYKPETQIYHSNYLETKPKKKNIIRNELDLRRKIKKKKKDLQGGSGSSCSVPGISATVNILCVLSGIEGNLVLVKCLKDKGNPPLASPSVSVLLNSSP